MDIHNLEAKFYKILAIASELLTNRLNKFENLFFYPNQPKLLDLGIIAPSISAETIGIDSENYLYGKLKSDYPTLFSQLPHRSIITEEDAV